MNENAYELIFNLYKIVEYLPKLSLIDTICSNLTLKCHIIDIFCLLNNINTFENNLKFDKFQREGYLYGLLNCEIYSMLTMLLITNLIDFNTINLIVIQPT